MREVFAALIAVGLGACAASGTQPGDFNDTKSSWIVNGASSGTSFPTVGFLASPDGSPFCTGTVIGPRTVLTAGHCVSQMGRTITPGEVRFGQGAQASFGATFTDVSAVTLHPSYRATETTLENDLALLTLATDVPRAATPLYEATVAVGAEMTLVGYGVTDGTTDTGAGEKRHVNVTVASVDAGTWRYDTVGGRSACRGDSGGPAFFDVGGTLHLAGVTSWGDETCTAMGNYTRIDAFLDFIRSGTATAAPGAEPAPEEAPAPPPPVADGPADSAGAVGCEDTCAWPGDGECDDGGPGSLYAVCAYGTDCTDCGPRDGSAPPTPGGTPTPAPPPAGGMCDDTCYWAGDGFCDDGGPDAEFADCFYGTDCADCGPR
jgi:secreted trypsin-like serine protease